MSELYFGKKSIIMILALFIALTTAALPVCLAAPLINMNVVDEDIAPVLHTLAKIGGRNIVIDQAVAGKITVQFNNVDFDTAMDIVTRVKGLTYQVVGNVVVVTVAEKMGKGFGGMHIFKMQYAQAEDMVASLSVLFADKGSTAANSNGKTDSASSTASTSSPGGTATGTERLRVDKATNSIVFYGTPAEAEQIRTMLSELDVAYQQVSLEAQVVAINKNASKNLGIEWTWQNTPTYPEYTTPTSTANSTTGITTTTMEDSITRDVRQGTIRYGRSPNGLPYEFYYQAKINALITNGNANILARPNITTINGKEAVINIGESVPLPVTTTQNNITTTSVEYKQVGIILKYTPRVNVDGYITATVHTEVSSPTLVPELKAYRFTTRSADTQVRLKDGETMVIGGLIGKEEAKSMSKIPFLGDLPVLGSLFRNNNNSKNESEVVIFLTAKIVK